MIISASRRTDIPAFYTPWFLRRLAAGYCLVPNPYRPSQLTRVSLQPADVDGIVFWTRDFRPLLAAAPQLEARGYPFVVLYTLNSYPRAIEPRCPTVSSSVETMMRLCELIGPERLIWRYDPIFYSELTSESWHQEQIARVAVRLRGVVQRVMISILDPYRKTQRRLRQEAGITVRPEHYTVEPYIPLLRWMGEFLPAAGIAVYTCAEDTDLTALGISPGACIDPVLLSRLFGCPVQSSRAQRPGCRCAAAQDIGVPTTCLFDCAYCYATTQPAAAMRQAAAHDPGAAWLSRSVGR